MCIRDSAVLAAEKLRMEKPVAETWVARLRGLTDAERVDPAVIYGIIERLSAPELAERELAFFLISHIVDPMSLGNKSLMSFDVGESADRREPFVRAWKSRAEAIKEKLKNMPPK